MAISYKDAGVDVERGYEAVARIQEHVKKTHNKNVLFGLGSFGGFFSLEEAINEGGIKKPILVSGTDGVGTKLKYAFVLDKHDTIGIDCVAMCVNDVVCQGAKPLFFLDYYASAKTKPTLVAEVVKGISEGCVMSGCALIGGETAEMPGFYAEGEYDLAGFCVGIVDKDKVINGESIKEGDVLIGLESNGLHSNGYSLARSLIGESKQALSKFNPVLNKAFKDEVLVPTRIYVKPILELIKQFEIKGIAHITGGGFIENIPRIFPKGLNAEIKVNSYQPKPIFTILRERSCLDDRSLYNTFNMGIGMVLCVDKAIADEVVAACKGLGESAYKIGHVIKGDEVILS